MTPPPTTPSAGWWLRLHAALMPDYNRRATLFWWLLVLLGAGLLAHHLWVLQDRPWAHWVHIGVAAGFAVVVGLCPVRLPGTRQSFVAGEIFIFLLLLLQGTEAAALAAATEAAVGALRSSRRWTSRLLSPAVALVSMTAVGHLLQLAAAGPLPGLASAPGLAGTAVAGTLSLPALLLVMTALATLNFALTQQLIGAVPRLKAKQAPWRPSELGGAFRWVGLAYLGSAVTAALMYAAYRQHGPGVLGAVLPVLLLLLVTLHLYALQQQAADAMRAAAHHAADEAARQLQALQASERRFNSAFEHAAIGMALVGPEGRLLQANPALRQLLAWPATGALPARFQDLVEAEFRPPFEAQLRRHAAPDVTTSAPAAPAPATAAATGLSFHLELRCRRADGQGLWALVHGGVIQGPEADAPRLILQLQDISARRQLEAGLHRLAFHDSLTGVPNRRQFMETLAAAVARHQQHRQAPADAPGGPAPSYALLYLDFDRFKLVNDSLGHKAGDELLVQLARRIQENLRPSDVVGRLGGDEFAVLVPQLRDEHDALHLAERLLQALRRPFRVAGHVHFASASIGITFSRFGYGTAEAALNDADSAMYEAKAAGKGRYALFSGRPDSPALDRHDMAIALREALAAGRLHLVFQPLVELANGRLRGFEALVRWHHPEAGWVAPASLIPLAEQSGLITALSDFVLGQACRQLAQWQRMAASLAGLTMGVNVTGHDLANPQFVSRVQRALQEAGLAPQHLVLELTEDAVMAQLDSAAANLSALRHLGVRVSVDDFGTGYSSLSQLARLPIDSIKIDRRFVQELVDDAGPATREHDVVRTLVHMGGALGKTVVAEGIETAQQAEQLRRMQPGLLGQGYHLAAPLSADDATCWLQAREQEAAAVLH